MRHWTLARGDGWRAAQRAHRARGDVVHESYTCDAMACGRM